MKKKGNKGGHRSSRNAKMPETDLSIVPTSKESAWCDCKTGGQLTTLVSLLKKEKEIDTLTAVIETSLTSVLRWKAHRPLAADPELAAMLAVCCSSHAEERELPKVHEHVILSRGQLPQRIIEGKREKQKAEELLSRGSNLATTKW